MSKPSLFIQSTDYVPTLNDNRGTLTVLLPANTNVPAGSFTAFNTDLAIGKTNATLRAQIASSKDSNIFAVCTVKIYTRSGLVSGSTAFYSVYAYLQRLNPTTLRATVLISNPYSSAITGATGDETFTFYANTFISPFA